MFKSPHTCKKSLFEKKSIIRKYNQSKQTLENSQVTLGLPSRKTKESSFDLKIIRAQYSSA